MLHLDQSQWFDTGLDQNRRMTRKIQKEVQIGNNPTANKSADRFILPKRKGDGTRGMASVSQAQALAK